MALWFKSVNGRKLTCKISIRQDDQREQARNSGQPETNPQKEFLPPVGTTADAIAGPHHHDRIFLRRRGSAVHDRDFNLILMRRSVQNLDTHDRRNVETATPNLLSVLALVRYCEEVAVPAVEELLFQR